MWYPIFYSEVCVWSGSKAVRSVAVIFPIYTYFLQILRIQTCDCEDFEQIIYPVFFLLKFVCTDVD